MENKNTKVRNYILELLETGECSEGEQLPPARQIAADLNISLLTVQNAQETLVKEGLLQVVPRRGTYVNPNWRSRILQDNISFYIPWHQLPWGECFRRLAERHLPHLRFSLKQPHSIFEIVTTAQVQTAHAQYLDLEPFLKRCYPDRSVFHQAPLKSFRCGGRLPGIPFLFSPRVLFFNPQMLREADCPVPPPDWEWDDFLNLIRRLLKHFPPEQVFFWYPSYYQWMNFVLRAGGRLIDPSAEDPVRIDSPATRRGLRLFRELRRELGLNGGSAIRKTEGAFEHGEVALAIDARQMVGRLKRLGRKEWDVLPLPHIPGGCDTSMQATELLCVRRECVDLDAAEELIRILLSEEFQDHLAELKYAIPLRKSSQELSLSKDDPRDCLFAREAAVVQAQYHLDSAELFQLVSSGISELLCGDEDIDTATAELGGMVRLYSKINRKIALGQRRNYSLAI